MLILFIFYVYRSLQLVPDYQNYYEDDDYIKVKVLLESTMPDFAFLCCTPNVNVANINTLL